LPLLPYLAVGRHDFGAAGVWLQQRQTEPLAKYCRSLAELDARDLDRLEENLKGDSRPRLAALARLLRNDPDGMAVVGRLLRVLWGRGTLADPPTEAQLRSYRDEHLAAPAVRLLAALGNLRDDKGQLAQDHLYEVLRAAPEAAVAVNRVVELLLLATPDDLTPARMLSNAVVGRWPENPHYRLTRARIQGAMGHWPGAVEDIEAALPQLADRAAGRRMLAEAYEHLGRPDEADAERRAAGP
jgi:predicted Zn-dependent protease